MKPHKHAELIKAWVDGAEVEYRYPKDDGSVSLWKDLTQCVFHEWYEYRIKPEPKTDIVKAFMLESHPFGDLRFYDATGFSREKDEQRIQVTFDGETGELKDAKVLK